MNTKLAGKPESLKMEIQSHLPKTPGSITGTIGTKPSYFCAPKLLTNSAALWETVHPATGLLDFRRTFCAG
jgi:hypothetical protein